MARALRKDLLNESPLVHKIIKGHNHEWIFHQDSEKEHYIKILNEKIINRSSQLHAICIMSNHVHEVYEAQNVNDFSIFMKEHHGKFAQNYNKIHKRSGALTLSRPKTIPIKTEFQFLSTILYTHANPLRSGIVNTIEELASYNYSSHLLYGYGIYQSWMAKIVLPNWYRELGRTTASQQINYMKIFENYAGNTEEEFLQKIGVRWGLTPPISI